jgi:hypothetical protein
MCTALCILKAYMRTEVTRGARPTSGVCVEHVEDGTGAGHYFFLKKRCARRDAPIHRSSLLGDRFDQARMFLLRPEFYFNATRCLLEEVNVEKKVSAFSSRLLLLVNDKPCVFSSLLGTAPHTAHICGNGDIRVPV